jgi:hypothetical protein
VTCAILLLFFLLYSPHRQRLEARKQSRRYHVPQRNVPVFL